MNSGRIPPPCLIRLHNLVLLVVYIHPITISVNVENATYMDHPTQRRERKKREVK